MKKSLILVGMGLAILAIFSITVVNAAEPGRVPGHPDRAGVYVAKCVFDKGVWIHQAASYDGTTAPQIVFDTADNIKCPDRPGKQWESHGSQYFDSQGKPIKAPK